VSGMKAKTINSIISHKINTWLETIEDQYLKQKLRKNVIVTGGCIASMLLGEDVNDFDIYLRDHRTAKAVAEYYVSRFIAKKGNATQSSDLEVTDENGRIKIVARSTGVAKEEAVEAKYLDIATGDNTEYIAKVLDNPAEIEDTHEDTEIAVQANPSEKQYRPVFLSSNAITLSNKIQIVLRFYGEPEEIHGNYDFAHCMNYWTSWNKELVLKQDALESLLSKELKYVGSLYPVCSVVRLRKFISRGWRINAGQILKMAMQISALDMTDLNVLEDQLTGVDTSYFVQLIKGLREKDPDKVDTAYLVEIINRIF
jgi:hypothetical protein